MLLESEIVDFSKFLNKKGYSEVNTSKNPYEILRCVRSPNKPRGITKDTVVVFKKNSGLITVMEKDMVLVKEFKSSCGVAQKTSNNVQQIGGSTQQTKGFVDKGDITSDFKQASRLLRSLGYIPSECNGNCVFKHTRGDDVVRIDFVGCYTTNVVDFDFFMVCDRMMGTSFKKLLLKETIEVEENPSMLDSEYPWDVEEDYEAFPDYDM